MTIDRVERTGIGVAAAGHVALFAALSLGLFAAQNKPPMQADPIDVMFVDEVGLKSAAPKAAAEAPAPSVATAVAPPEDAAPPPQPEVVPEPKPAKPAEPKPERPAKPVEPKPAKVAEPKPERPAKPTRSTADDTRGRRRPDRLAGTMQSIAAAVRADRKPKGARLGSDFLKGISPEKSEGKAATPQAAAVSARAMAGLAAAIAGQVRPCYVVPAGGTEAERIVTVLRLRFAPDGRVATTPQVTAHNGITPANQAYVRQMDDAAKRAVLRCAPLKLPAELYDNGWEDIEFAFRPEAMN